MSRVTQVRTGLAALAALTSLVVVAGASAAAWQGPVQLSEPLLDTGFQATISLGAAGDAVAGWSEAGTQRIVVARKPAGGAWSAPVGLATGLSAAVVTGTDGSGNATIAYAATGPVTMVSTWTAGAPAPSAPTPIAIAGMTVEGLAVNAAGDAILVGRAGVTPHVAVAYRHGFGGAFQTHTFDSVS